MTDELWEDNYEMCPCNILGECTWSISYNQHVNDPRYTPCIKELCPIFFWVKAMITKEK